MAKHILVRTRGASLVPADPYADEQIDGLNPEKTYKVTITSDRSRGELNLYWAGLGLLHGNLPDEDAKRWPTSEALSKMLLTALGFMHREYYLDSRSEDGVGWQEVADSIALDNMDPETFKTYFENVKAIAVARWSFDPWALWIEQQEEYEQMRKRG